MADGCKRGGLQPGSRKLMICPGGKHRSHRRNWVVLVLETRDSGRVRVRPRVQGPDRDGTGTGARGIDLTWFNRCGAGLERGTKKRRQVSPLSGGSLDQRPSVRAAGRPLSQFLGVFQGRVLSESSSSVRHPDNARSEPRRAEVTIRRRSQTFMERISTEPCHLRQLRHRPDASQGGYLRWSGWVRPR